ncbi:hypothetical protein VTL71DRAFT_2935 [Oculimacula yallundae]|uniref:Uncharacterized protein n=1 Tax=Oculimacula yallundae TaxID=86028 RepID=A0ABR4C7H5_9HELO
MECVDVQSRCCMISRIGEGCCLLVDVREKMKREKEKKEGFKLKYKRRGEERRGEKRNTSRIDYVSSDPLTH